MTKNQEWQKYLADVTRFKICPLPKAIIYTMPDKMAAQLKPTHTPNYIINLDISKLAALVH